VRVYLAFDDTDTKGSDKGTGKLARGFEKFLPDGSHLWGVVRQQLLVDDRIPYTSHNSSACIVVDLADASQKDELFNKATAYLESESSQGSDPGLCFASEEDISLDELTTFGFRCTCEIVTQEEARKAAKGLHLSGHGGTNDGIIGALAAVGLTASGWTGRIIELGRLRDLPAEVSVDTLNKSGIKVLSVDRCSFTPAPGDIVITNGWLRPRLWGHQPVLPVTPDGQNRWESIGKKNLK
jgi:tRNA(Ile2) C34 agmatinyltransferase TiaS